MDGVVGVELISHVTESERQVGSLGATEYRYLGTCDLAVDRTAVTRCIQITMSLNVNGELETSIVNLSGLETARYIGVGGMQRHPVELPTSVVHQDFEPAGWWVFVPEGAHAVRSGPPGLRASFAPVRSRTNASAGYLESGLSDLQDMLVGEGSVPPNITPTRFSTLASVSWHGLLSCVSSVS